MVFYIGDGNGQTRGQSGRRHQTALVTVKHAVAKEPRKPPTGLTRDQAGFGQTGLTGLDSRFVFFARANADDTLDVGHEDLAVTDLAGASRTDDGVNNLIRL
ncbi:hypothetical protein AWB69_08878 [Caballeronia udeis]|uniref:Uncharacterized protein n=1 Tax=Caballeronia udeis TaxID=1232866 RepID=A0A158JVL6_9BURK|nr:hypothetical protein AWB69_08878 [Caballeronia udeis]